MRLIYCLIFLLQFVVNKSIFVIGEEPKETTQDIYQMNGDDFVRVMDSINSPIRTSNKDNVDLLVEKVNNLRPWLADQMSWIDCVFYYSAAITIIFVFTSTIRTHRVRFPLFVSLLANFIAERLLYSYNVQNLYLSDFTEYYYSDLMYQIWMLRYFVIICMIIRYIFHYVRHENVKIVNSELLKNIYHQNEILLQKLTALQNVEAQYNVINEKENLQDNSNKNNEEAQKTDDKQATYSPIFCSNSNVTIATIKDLRDKLFKNPEKNNSSQTDDLPKYTKF